jgi:hypothetical protein
MKNSSGNEIKPKNHRHGKLMTGKLSESTNEKTWKPLSK